MSTKENKDLVERIKAAIAVSAQKMLESKKRLGQKIVISENGVIKIIDLNKG